MKCKQCKNKISEFIMKLNTGFDWCEDCINLNGKKAVEEMGKDPFGGTDNHTVLLEDFIKTMAEFQVKHRLDFGSLLTFPKVFTGMVNVEDVDMLTIYANVLRKHGMDVNGTDL